MANIKLPAWTLAGVAVATAGIIAGVLIAVTQMTSSDGTEPSPTPRTQIPRQGNVLGFSDAPVTIIEYSDFQCPFCRRFFLETERLIIANFVQTGQVKLEYRHFAFLGPESLAAAEAAECANEQGQFWPYHDLLFQRQGRENSGAFSKDNLIAFARELGLDTGAFSTCLTSGRYREKVLSQTQEGRSLGITGTPSFLIGRQLIRGAQPYEVFVQAIQQALAEAPSAR